MFAPDFKAEPFWLDGSKPKPVASEPLPRHADVLVIGSGYTGLNAALQTARGGRATIVLEAGDPGRGCSTRNGGMISSSIKPDLARLTRRFGPERAEAIRAEGRRSLDWIDRFVTSEAIECDFRRSGRFHGAHSPKAFERLQHLADAERREGIACDVVSRDHQHGELGTDFYHGGLIYPDHATLHPANYQKGLLDRAMDAGVRLHPHCAARAIRSDGDQVEIETEKGVLRARDVVVATNGYTSRLTPWLRRRIIPIGSYVIATEPLPDGMVDRLFPTRRPVTDSRRVVFYYGPSPDRRCLIFGGRVSAGECDPEISGPRLHAEMVRIFPELTTIRIAHAWMGFVAYTFDELPHTGVHGGIHYAMGYCGSGVGMASYLGMRMGQRILGLSDGRTAFDDLPFPTRPLYAGRPWFLSAAVSWYRWLDRVERHLAVRRTG